MLRTRITADFHRNGRSGGSSWGATGGLAATLGLAVLVAAGCRPESRIETLPSFAVDLKWDRPGAVDLELDSVDSGQRDQVVTLSFDAVGRVELRRLVRRFDVIPSVEPAETGRTEASPVELDRLAQRAIRDHYPQLASNAEAPIAPASIPIGDASIDLDGRSMMASVTFAVDPESPQEGSPSVERLPARVEAVRLVSRERPGDVVLEAVGSVEEDAYDFDLSDLDDGDCAALRSILLGETFAIVTARVERRGRAATVVASESSPGLEESLREAAKVRLRELARGGSPSDLELRLARDPDAAPRALVHGGPLPAAFIENVGDRPAVEFSSLLYQVEMGDGEVIFDSFLDPVDCLCPGERIELPAPTTTTDPCLPELEGGDGLRYVVKSTLQREIFGLQAPPRGGLPLAARPFGRFEILPVSPGPGGVVEAEDLDGRGASDLQLQMRCDGETLTLPFPELPPRGRAGVRVPDDLPAEARSTWAAWVERAGAGEGAPLVELELIEQWRRGCDSAVPARQRLRLVG
jgi:hypothetical protein